MHRLGIRLGQAVLTYAVAVTLAFVLMRLTPGDPIPQLDDQQRYTAEQAARLAAMAPNPRFYERNQGAPGLNRKIGIILARMPSAELP